jgi:hypothetical protein
MNYNEASQLVASEKITLVTIESVERVKLFSPSGSDWTRTSEFFVVGVKDSGVSITSWFFDPLTKLLTITGGADPKTRNISLTYRHFFSTTPLNMANDLSTGSAVEWFPYITQIGSVGQSLDEESTGVVLETTSSVTLINQGFFDDIFDTLIFENQLVKIYSWFSNTSIEEHTKLFEGIVESKDYSPSTVSFKVKDFIYKLKTTLNLGLFSGNILPSIVGTPRRRIYGKADNVKGVSLDATLSGYDLTGTLAFSAGTKTITGTSTLFLTEASIGDEIVIELNGTVENYGIDAISSNTSMTISKELPGTATSISAKIKPQVPYRFKNRTWEIAGHKLRAPSMEIISVSGGNAFVVDSAADVFVGDSVLINGYSTTIRRISGSTIITNASIPIMPSPGDLILKQAIDKVLFKSKELFLGRDFTISNDSTGARVVLDELAEFNISNEKPVKTNIDFTNGSNTITTVNAVDFRSILKPRDWIRSGELNEPEYYEILDVTEGEIILREPFTGGTNGTTGAIYKNVEYVDENSLITVNCMGGEFEGNWLKTPSDCVRHMILNDAGFPSVNESKFAKAKSDCDYIVSMILPESTESNSPTIRDTITKINESIFGSLYGDSSQSISFSVLNAEKPETSNILTDTDIINFSVQTNQKILNKIKVNYRPYVDVYSEESTFKTLVQTSDFVDKYIGIENEIEKTIYLYEEDKALIIAQRLLLFNSLSNSSVKIKSKLNLAKTVVNDKIYLSLDRLYKRFSGRDKRKIAIVTSVKIDGYNTELTLVDLGNIFNRVPSIAPNSTNNFNVGAGDEILKYGFILSNTTETPDESSEIGLGSNIIG